MIPSTMDAKYVVRGGKGGTKHLSNSKIIDLAAWFCSFLFSITGFTGIAGVMLFLKSEKEILKDSYLQDDEYYKNQRLVEPQKHLYRIYVRLGKP